jgi:hypothetical protein
MILKNTLKNLQKTKESFFNLEKGVMVNTDLLKKGLMVYLHQILVELLPNLN